MKNNLSQTESKFSKDATSLAPEALGLLVGLFSVSLSIYLGVFIIIEPSIEVSDYIQIFMLFVVACTLGVSVFVQREKEKLDESQAYLTSAVDLINKAYDILSDEEGKITTDRISWVTAARLLTRSSSLASRISLPSHRSIFESEHDFQRHRFNDLLKIDGESLPLEFFCGTGYVKGSIGASACNTITEKGANWLPPRAVSAIYQFKEYPDGYDDPLNDSREFYQSELNKLWILGERGMFNYLVFRKHFIRINKQVIFKNGTQEPIVMDAKDIDGQMDQLSGEMPN